MASKLAYEKCGIDDPREDIDFVELHDAYTSSEIQTYEDMGLCKYGDGGKFIEQGVRLAMSGFASPFNSSTSERRSKSDQSRPLVETHRITSGFFSRMPEMIL